MDSDDSWRVTEAHAALIDAGFRPQRHAWLVRPARRVLWPLIRPFLFHLLDRMPWDPLRRDQAMDAVLRRVVNQQAALRADTLALGHGQGWIEDRLAGLADDLDRVLARVRADADERASASHMLFLAATEQGVFVLKRGDLISEGAARTGAWDRHVIETADAAAHLRRGIAIDAGAHFGLLSIPLARRFERVVSFEPNLFSHSLLIANAALNGCRNIDARDASLFSRAARMSLAPAGQQEVPMPLTAEGSLDIAAATNLGALSFALGGQGPYAGEAITLDSLGLDDLAFLKVDAQGADGEVLLGAEATISRCRPWVVFEWEDALSRNFSVGFERIEALFDAACYRVSVLHRHNEKQVDYLAVPREDGWPERLTPG